MFVLVQCWENVSRDSASGTTLAVRLAGALSHAGVSITVTTATDILAFGVGAVTVSSLSSQKPFCEWQGKRFGCNSWFAVSYN